MEMAGDPTDSRVASDSTTDATAPIVQSTSAQPTPAQPSPLHSSAEGGGGATAPIVLHGGCVDAEIDRDSGMLSRARFGCDGEDRSAVDVALTLMSYRGDKSGSVSK